MVLRRAVGTLVMIVVLVATLAGVPGARAEAAARPALTLASASPIVGETVAVTTRLATRVVRPAVLQRLSGSRWLDVVTTRSASTGQVVARFRLRWSSVTLRVLAPAYRSGGRRYDAVVSGALRVVARPQSVSLRTARDAAGRVDATLIASHLRRGRRSELQEQAPDGSWRTLASTAMAGSRTITLPDAALASAVRGKRLRARLAPLAGAPATVSSVQEPPRVRPPTVDAGDVTTLSVTTSGAVRKVRFYVDGVLAGEDTSAPWSVQVQPSSGRHDAVVRAVGPVESVLSEAVTFERDSPPLGADTGIAEGFALDTVQNGLELPTSAGTTTDGAVLVAEKSGVVKIIEPTEGGWAVPRPVLDLSAAVLDQGDAGLTGLAVDPGFADNGQVYVALVRDDGSDELRSQQVLRFTWDGEVLDPASRHVVLGSVTGPACADPASIRTPDCVPLIGEAHTIGDLVFDDEGNLLVGIGDGSLYATENGLPDRHETLRAQDPEVLSGKVLRIDPATGHGVPGNPLYAGDGSSNSSRVLALGLRNPFRFTVREHQLVIGDVGEGSWEEVDVVDLTDLPAQAPNFGWPCREGDEDTALGSVTAADSPWHACAAVRAPGGSLAPSYSYPHRGNGGSVTGGVFLDAPSYPASVRGRYILGDYAQMFIRTASIDHDGEVSAVTELADATAAEGPVKFFTGPDGLVWSVSIMTGSLRRVRWTGEPLADRCPVGTFRRAFHDLDGPDSAFDQDWTTDPQWSWLFPYAAVQLPTATVGDPSCEPVVALPGTSGTPWLAEGGTDDRAHPGDRFGTSWRGRIDVEAGTWRFQVDGTEWVRLWVDNQPVHDFYANAFWGDERVHDVVLSRGQHLVAAEHIHGDADEAAAEVTWTRVGGPPSIRLTAPASGQVATDGTVPWSVTVADPDGDDVASLEAGVELAVDLLHYTGGTFHAHPSSRVRGEADGTVSIDDVHAPGSVVVRLRASVADASGARTTSAPVYVCPVGSTAGPCAD